MNNYQTIIARFSRKRILVVGDILLDQYIHGTVSRVSPEAPVPIVLQQGEPLYTPGGSANVAYNLRSLGARVTVIGKVGDDKEGQYLTKAIKSRGIDAGAILVDPKVPTSLKTRIVAQHQQVLRLDREKIEPSSSVIEQKILNYVGKNLKNFDAVILSDYGKGLMTSRLVSEICALSLRLKKTITVDPKVENFYLYRGVTCITPNRKEAENAIRDIKIKHEVGEPLAINRDRLETDEDIDQAGMALLNYLNLSSLLITLSEQGMRLFERGKKPVHIDTRAQEVYDVTGAGDTVIAVFTLALAAGASKKAAAEIANFAAGVVVGRRGAVAINRSELVAALTR